MPTLHGKKKPNKFDTIFVNEKNDNKNKRTYSN